MKKEKFIWLVCLTMVFMVGLQAMDMGASLKIIETSGVKTQAEGLFFTNVEPRVLYHAGLLVVVLSWLILCIISIHVGEK